MECVKSKDIISHLHTRIYAKSDILNKNPRKKYDVLWVSVVSVGNMNSISTLVTMVSGGQYVAQGPTYAASKAIPKWTLGSTRVDNGQ